MKKQYLTAILILIATYVSAQKLGYYRLNIDDTKFYTELLYGDRVYFDKGERPLLQQFVTYVRANKGKLPVKKNTKVNVSALTSFNYVQAADGYYESFLKDGTKLKYSNNKDDIINFISNNTPYSGTFYPLKKETHLYDKSYTIILDPSEGGVLNIYQPDKKWSYYKKYLPISDIVQTFEEGTKLVYDTPKLKIYEHPSALHSNRINTLRYFVEKYPSSSYFMDAVNFIKEKYPDYLQVQANENYNFEPNKGVKIT